MPSSLGVSVVVIKDAAVLLILRGDFPVWGLPGGAVEAGESVAEAAIREVREETGVEVHLTRLVGIYFRPQGVEGNHQALFTAEIVSGNPTPDGFESLKVEWFPIEHLPERLLGLHRLSVQDAQQDGPAVVRSLNIYPTLAQFARQEIYNLRDQGKLDLKALLAELCAPIEENNITEWIESKSENR
jgi:ADP-ribose pyrophosphatase YjhB (NUDIX family)